MNWFKKFWQEFKESQQVRKALRKAKFPQRSARVRPQILLFLALCAAGLALWAAAAGLLAGIGIEKNESNDAAAAVLAVSAVLIGYSQWRDARHEATLERFFERLAIANQWREKMKDVDAFTMYVFAELDNLEYVIEKYKLGYVTPELAYRALRTFRSRCEKVTYSDSPDAPSRRFSTEARLWLNEDDAGYLPTTREVGNAVIQHCDASTGR